MLRIYSLRPTLAGWETETLFEDYVMLTNLDCGTAEHISRVIVKDC
jgi:hypothetical protein